MYVGIDMETDSYRLYNRERRIYYSRRYEDVVFERPDNVYEYDPADDANLGVPRIDGIRDGVLIDEDVEESDDDYSSSDSDSAPNLNSENDSSSSGDSSSSDSEEDDNEDNTASVWVSGDMSNWTAVKFASRYNISFQEFEALQSKNGRIAGFKQRDRFEIGTELRIRPKQQRPSRSVVWRARLARFGKARAAVMDQQDQLSINPSGKPEMFGTLGLTNRRKIIVMAIPDDPVLSKINKLEKVPLKFAQEHMKKVHMEQIHWSIFTGCMH
jgi:hypothetical protein